MTLPAYINNNCSVDFFLNNGRTGSPTKLTLTEPDCQVHDIQYSVNSGSALTLSIHTGHGNFISSGSITQRSLYPKATDLTTFINQIRGTWCIVRCATTAEPTETVRGTVAPAQYSDWLPVGTSPITGGDTSDKTILGVFFIWKTKKITGNFSQTLELTCVDVAGWMQIRHMFALPRLSEEGTYDLVHFDNLPNYNEKSEQSWMTPNCSNEDASITPLMGGYNPTLNCEAFSSLGVANLSGAYWTHHSIIDQIFSYLNSYEAKIWEQIGVTLNWVDETGNLDTVKETINSHQSMYDIILQCCDRKRGLMVWWDYTETEEDGITIWMHVGLQSKTALVGFNPLTTFAYTLANSAPVRHYAQPPEIEYVDNDRYYGVRANSMPVTFIYTLNLNDSFKEGWSGTPPDDEEIERGGLAEHFYQRFILDPDVLPKLSSYNLTAQTLASESWSPSATHLGVRMTSSSGPDMIDTSTVNYPLYMPYNQTLELANLPDITGGHSPMEHLFFYKNGTDDLEAVEDVTVKFGPGGVIQFKGDTSFRDDMADPETRKNYFLTVAIKGTPPLYVEATKPNPTYENSWADVNYEYNPVVVMQNTVIGIDDTGTPKLFNTSASQPVMVSTTINNGISYFDLWNTLNIYGQSFIRDKNKVSWVVDHIDTNNFLLGQWITDIDLPCTSSVFTDGGGDVVGAGYVEWETITIDAVVTKVVYDFNANQTHYYTEFQTFRTK